MPVEEPDMHRAARSDEFAGMEEELIEAIEIVDSCSRAVETTLASFEQTTSTEEQAQEEGPSKVTENVQVEDTDQGSPTSE